MPRFVAGDLAMVFITQRPKTAQRPAAAAPQEVCGGGELNFVPPPNPPGVPWWSGGVGAVLDQEFTILRKIRLQRALFACDAL